jgi:Alginate export
VCRAARYTVAACMSLFPFVAAWAQQSPYRVLRQDEEWRTNDPGRPPYKAIVLDDVEDVVLTLGLDARVQLRSFDNEGWGQIPGSDPHVNVRMMPYADLALGRRFRLFGALRYGDSFGRETTPPPVDRDRGDVHQAFAELAFGDAFGLEIQDLIIRVGRQEVSYGAGRMISVRQGPSVRLSYDGVFLRGKSGGWTVDSFAARPATTRPGSFDDATDDSRAIWAAYASKRMGRDQLDLYYIGYTRDRSAIAGISGREERHSLGARYAWNGEYFSGDVEATAQVGSLGVGGGDRPVRGWSLAGTASYRFDGPLQPTLGLMWGINSGSNGQRRLGTFRAPDPPGRFFGASNRLGPGNIGGFAPSLAFRPHPALTLTASSEFFWRTSLNDGIYSPAGAPVRPGSPRDARYLGTELTVAAEWRVNPNITVGATAAHFVTGAFFDTRPPNRNIGYGALQVDFRY